MSEENDKQSRGRERADEFAAEAEQPSPGLLREYVDFLKYNKKWWLLPIIFALLLVGVLIIFGGTAAAPFIYTLF